MSDPGYDFYSLLTGSDRPRSFLWDDYYASLPAVQRTAPSDQAALNRERAPPTSPDPAALNIGTVPAGGGGVIAGRDGRLYTPTPEQADAYYREPDFRRQQELLKAFPTASDTPAPAGPSRPLAVSPDLYRPVSRPIAPGDAAATPGPPDQVIPSGAPPAVPPAPVQPVSAETRRLLGLPATPLDAPQQQKPSGGLLERIFGGGGAAKPGPYDDILTPEQRSQLAWKSLGLGKMAAAFAEAAKPSLLPTGGIGAAIGKAAGAAADSEDEALKNMLGMSKVAQEVRDLRDKATTRKELSAGLDQLNQRLSGRGSGVRVDTTTGSIIPPGGGDMRAGDALTSGPASDPRNNVPYITQAAVQRGIDPKVAVAVARSEGLGTFLGDGGKSGGAFQLYTGGGVGNEFKRDTGLDPLDPRNEKATIDYALDYAKRNGWGAWNGAKKIGVTGYAGIGGPGTQAAPTGAPGGGAIPVGAYGAPGAGAPGGGAAGYDDALALLLAGLGSKAQLAGLGDVVKPYETYLYNQPGYKGQVKSAETAGEWGVREPIEQRARREQSGLDTARDAARLAIEAANKRAELQRQAELDITPPQPIWNPQTGQVEIRPLTRADLAGRLAPPAAPAAPAAPPPAAGPAAPAGPLPDAGGLVPGGGLPFPVRPPQAAPGPPGAAPAGPPGGILPAPPEAPKDYRPIWNPSKRAWEFEPVPGSPTYQAQQTRDASELQVANRGIQSIDRALALSGPYSTGWVGARLAGVEGQPAYDLAAEVVQLRALTSFAELQKMRAASPTGAALGAVSDTEGKKLESTITQLDQFQSKPRFDSSLQRLREEYLDTVYGSREKLAKLVQEGKISQRVFDSVEALKTGARGQAGGPGGAPSARPAMGGLQIGEVRKGHRYLGGDPNSQSSWEATQGGQ